MTPDRTRALSLARDIVRDIALARELALILDPDLDDVRALVFAVTRALTHAQALNRARARADLLSISLISARDRTLRLDLTSDPGRELNDVLRGVIEKVEFLVSQLPGMEDPAVNATTPVKRLGAPARAAARVADLASRVLPVAHRARYQDEYRSELYEKAAAGASWWQQIVYAIRLLACSWELRYELRQHARRRARS